MALDFPNSPSVGQIFNTADRDWKWSGTRWESYGTTPGAGGGGAYADSIPPLSPNTGDFWFDTNTGRLYVWYDGGWVEATGAPSIADAALLTGTTLAPNVVNSSMPRGWRNKILNGGFEIMQRDVANYQTNAYFIDQWKSERSGTTLTASRQTFNIGTNQIPGYEPFAFMRGDVIQSAGPAASDYALFQQRIEGVRTLAGQEATLSFWARANAAGKSVSVEFTQYFGAGGSPSAEVVGISPTKFALSTGWQRFSMTFTVPAITSKTLGSYSDFLGFNLWVSSGANYNARNATLGQQAGTFDFAQIQLEAGPVATPFEVRPLGDTQLACQRYLCQFGGNNTHESFAVGFTQSATVATAVVTFPVQMRGGPAYPTIIYPGVIGVNNFAAQTPTTSTVLTGISMNASRSSNKLCWLDILSTSMGVNMPMILFCNGNTSIRIMFSAEL